MMDYVADPNYELDNDRPGLCAGIAHYELEGGGHQFKLLFTDQVLDYRAEIPDQKNPPVDKYET